jgi:hypothetical protein
MTIFDDLGSILPSLPVLPTLPNTIGGVNVPVVTKSLKIASVDIPRMSKDFEKRKFRDMAEISIEDVLQVSNMFGVPGMGIAATVAPYMFDTINALVDGHGKITGKEFVNGMDDAQSNIGAIIQALDKGENLDVGAMAISDLLGLAENLSYSPYFALTGIIVQASVYCIKVGVPIDILHFFESAVDKVVAIPGSLIENINHQLTPEQLGFPKTGAINPSNVTQVWSPLHGWVIRPSTHSQQSGIHYGSDCTRYGDYVWSSWSGWIYDPVRHH